MPQVYIGIGSNIEPQLNIRYAIERLREQCRSLAVSTVYRSPAVGFVGADFLNLAVGFATELEVRRLAIWLRELEALHGRQRDSPGVASRTLDLDLLIYGDWVLEEPGLCIPRPEITQYAFVLCPLAEIAGGWRHPQLGVTLAELWAQFDRHAQPLQPVALNLQPPALL